MERFIGMSDSWIMKNIGNLKSSMERFIVQQKCIQEYDEFKFKIQYGEIYSNKCSNLIETD